MKFFDQPNGHCSVCRWNESPNSLMNCHVPQTHVTNIICIAKMQSVHLSNIAYFLQRRDEEGEEWKGAE